MDVNDLPVHFGYDDDYAGSETETEASYSIPRQNSQPDDVLQLIKRGLSPINLSNSTRWKDTMEIFSRKADAVSNEGETFRDGYFSYKADKVGKQVETVLLSHDGQFP